MTKSSSKTYSFSKRSKDNLVGVHPDLVRVFERAIQITTQDFIVVEGVRTPERQEKLFGEGRTVAQCIAGDGVRKMDPERAKEVSNTKETRKTKTLKSNHFVNPTNGFGHAVDIVPYPVDYEGPTKFPKHEAIARAVKQAAAELKVRIEWGGDWVSFRDRPHFQLDRTTYR